MEQDDKINIANTLTSSAAARRLAVSAYTVRGWAVRGRLRAVLSPAGWLFDRQSVEQLAREREAHGATTRP